MNQLIFDLNRILKITHLNRFIFLIKLTLNTTNTMFVHVRPI